MKIKSKILPDPPFSKEGEKLLPLQREVGRDFALDSKSRQTS
jgi:hypothetical protein